MAKKVAILTNEQMVQPFTTRDALAQYLLHAMEERANVAAKATQAEPVMAAVHLHLDEMEPGDQITV